MLYHLCYIFFFFNDTATTEIYTLSLHDALPIFKKKIGWAPKVVRTPPIPSKTVEEIRQYLRTINDERQTFLKQVGRRLAREVPAGENYVRITALGGFRQVGRSAALLSTRESKVLIDCGVLISEDNGSPHLNAPEVTPLSSIDAVVLTPPH